MQAYETTFNQDLNGDGIIGIRPPGIKINITFDSFALGAPQSFRDAVQTAANILQNAFLDPITVNITVGYGEIGGQSLPSQSGAEGGFNSGFSVSYSALRAALAGDITTGDATSPP